MLASTFFSIRWYETMCMPEVPIEDLWCYKLCTDSGQWSGVEWTDVKSNRMESHRNVVFQPRNIKNEMSIVRPPSGSGCKRECNATRIRLTEPWPLYFTPVQCHHLERERERETKKLCTRDLIALYDYIFSTVLLVILGLDLTGTGIIRYALALTAQKEDTSVLDSFT